MKRILSLILVLVLVLGLVPMTALAEGVCHLEHTDSCYTECNHTHNNDCYPGCNVYGYYGHYSWDGSQLKHYDMKGYCDSFNCAHDTHTTECRTLICGHGASETAGICKCGECLHEKENGICEADCSHIEAGLDCCKAPAQPVTYKVTLKYSNGYTYKTVTEETTDESWQYTLEELERTCYEFLGWEAGDDLYTGSVTLTKQNPTVELTAKWRVAHDNRINSYTDFDGYCDHCRTCLHMVDGVCTKPNCNHRGCCTKKSLNVASVDAIADQIYNGQAQTPAVVVKYNGAELVKDTDYTVTYENNTNAGTAKAIITGKGAYKDTVEKSFTIKPAPLTVTVVAADKVYDGNTAAAVTVTVEGEVEGEEITGTATGTFADKNVGEDKAVAVEVTLTPAEGTLLSNYSYELPTSAAADITKKAATITADDKSKVCCATDPELTATVEGVLEGDTLNYTLSRKAGEKVGTYDITVTLGDNLNYEVTVKSGKFTITQGHVCTPVYTGCTREPFIDVHENDWFHDDVCYVYKKDLMNGVSATRFDPDGDVTRAMVVTTLWRMAGSPKVLEAPEFSDVAEGLWYSKAIDWAAANGIVLGHGDGTFAPMESVTREQVAAMMNRYATYKKWSANVKDTEAYIHSDWAEENVDWAETVGLFKGLKVVDLTKTADRAELAAYLTRFCKNVVK